MAVSEPIIPGQGRVYGLDKSGQRLNVTVRRSVQGGRRAGRQLRVRLNIFDRWGKR